MMNHTPIRSSLMNRQLQEQSMPSNTIPSVFKTALFAGDLRSLRLRTENPRCRGLKPDLVVTDLRQLIRLI